MFYPSGHFMCCNRSRPLDIHLSPFLLHYRVFKPSAVRRSGLLVLMLVMYAVVLPFCYFTAGEPRKAAMVAAQRLADEKWAKEAFTVPNATALLGNSNGNGTAADGLAPPGIGSDAGVAVAVEVGSDGLPIPAAPTATNAAASAAAAAVAAEADKLKREKDAKAKDGLDRLKAKAASGLSAIEAAGAGAGGGGGLFGSLFGQPSAEQKHAKAEFDQWQKQFNERSPTGPVSLPPEYLPSAWACLALFAR